MSFYHGTSEISIHDDIDEDLNNSLLIKDMSSIEPTALFLLMN